MRQQTEDERKLAALMALAANFGKEFSESLLGIWLNLLSHYSADAVDAGVSRVIEKYVYKTLPPYAVLRISIDEAIGLVQPEHALDMAALAEWNKLIADIGKYGRYNCPQFCATTAYVLRGMGGWDAACSWDTEKLEWRRREFVESWKLAHGKEHVMELGSQGIAALVSSKPESSRAIVGRVLEITQ